MLPLRAARQSLSTTARRWLQKLLYFPHAFCPVPGRALARRCRGQRAGTPRAASLLPTPPVLQRRGAFSRRVAPGCPNSACPKHGLVLWPRVLPHSACPPPFGMRQGCKGRAQLLRGYTQGFWGGLVQTGAALPQGCCELRASSLSSSLPVLHQGCWAGPAGPARSHPRPRGTRVPALPQPLSPPGAEVPRPRFWVQTRAACAARGPARCRAPAAAPLPNPDRPL